MDLNRISIFLKVVEAGSFTRAAKLLGLPKTTVSRKVAELESALTVRLLHRTTRSLGLTDAGKRYYHACSTGIAAIEDANRRIVESQLVPIGTIRLSAPADFGGYFLADAVAEFLARHRKVSIEVLLTDELVNLVEEGIDLALRTGALQDSRLVARKIAPAPRAFCASPAYLDAAGIPQKPSDLSEHDCIVLGSSLEGVTWTIETPDGSRTTVPVKGRIAANTMLFALRACVAGLGIARLPLPMAAGEIHAGRLRTVLLGHGATQGGIYAVYPSSRHVPLVVTTFVDFVAERLRSFQEGAFPQAWRGP